MGFWTLDDYFDPVVISLSASCEHFIAVCESTVDYVDFPNASCCIVEAIANCVVCLQWFREPPPKLVVNHCEPCELGVLGAGAGSPDQGAAS